MARLTTALLQQSDPDFEVVIVDNNCPQGAARKLDISKDSRFQIVTSLQNLGFAGGCNLGAKDAMTPWLITLNPDTLPNQSWVADLKRAMSNHPEAQIFGSTLISAKQPEKIDGFGDVLSVFGVAWPGGAGQSVGILPDEDRQVFSVCGAAAIYNRKLFENLGGFDDDFFCYLEDVDLCWRANVAGVKIVQLINPQCQHIRSVSTQDDPNFRLYHTSRNVIWTYGKSAPLWRLPELLIKTFGSSFYLTLRGSYGRGTSARWKGLLVGFLTLPKALKKRSGQASNRREAFAKLSRSRDALKRRMIASWPL